MKKILGSLRPILILIREIFPYALLIYLVFFLLEVLFPGFISNNFDLNYALIVILILAALSIFAPMVEKKEEFPKENNRNLIVILTVLSFLVLLFRTRDMGVSGLVIAGIGSLLTAGMSAVIIYSPDEEEDRLEKEVKTEKKNTPFVFHLPQLNIFKYLRSHL